MGRLGFFRDRPLVFWGALIEASLGKKIQILVHPERALYLLRVHIIDGQILCGIMRSGDGNNGKSRLSEADKARNT